MSERLSIVLSGMLASVPGQGGASWALLQYLLGLRRLGHDVLFVEPIETGGSSGATTEATAYFAAVVERFGLHGRAALLDAASGATLGVARADVERFADGADVLLNVSGRLADEDLLGRIGVRAYVDLDPAFTQLWAGVEGIDLGFDRHNRFVTIGLAIGDEACPVPTCGRDWITSPQPVVLEHWPVAEGPAREALTSIGHWRAYGSVHHDGVHYGQRAHSLRALVGLPELLPVPVVLALGIHSDERADLAALRDGGWRLEDPALAAADPDRYARFVAGSWAELGIAKSGYVASACGWFSDRSACYLASGRPVVAQETGFSAFLPSGEGLLAFASADEAVAAVEAIRARYPAHRRAAREIAEQHLDSDRVLPRVLACL